MAKQVKKMVKKSKVNDQDKEPVLPFDMEDPLTNTPDHEVIPEEDPFETPPAVEIPDPGEGP